MRAADLLGPDGPIARALPGYEHRESQRAMATLVEDTLAHKGVALIEAGTGTGKTLAYLVPALLSGKRVVVSTGTRALQDQIMEQDLPFLSAHLGEPVNAAVMKGLTNYLCRRRWREALEGPASEEPAIARRLPVLMDWVERTEVGDLSEVAALSEDDAAHAAVRSSSETRIGPRCSFHDECFVTAMRARAQAAQLVIVNHHLFFADLAMRGPHGGGVIPDYDAVIFDEAHQIEDVATRFFGVVVSDATIEKLCRDAERSTLDVKLSMTLRSRAGMFFAALPDRPARDGGRADLPGGFFEGGAGAAAHHALDAALEALELAASREDSESFAQLARRARRVRDELGRVATPDTRHVRWTERAERRVAVGASPVDVSSLFRDEVLHRVPALVLTSATLTTGGTFDFTRRRLGFDFEVDEVVLPSPFDFAKQAALYLPPLPDPRSPAWFDDALDEVVRLVRLTRGGAFVLCTSVRVMRQLADASRRRLTGLPLYVQGEAPKSTLLTRFRNDGDAVLFATMSFWQGIDVPGDALRLVVMDKLPFDVPTDPLVEARCRHMEEAGEQPFIRYLVPSAALGLKQGFGRLIRTRRDRGIVAVLDSRLTTKGYGKVFLRSLPEATRCPTFADLEVFYQDGDESGRPR
ncbi:MAG: ATP-dependent DNA helicase [Sandaracinaceae bacterium]|nr:ATP-dependent DNA helicase [Sandaracinaceae bacterium]